MKLYPLFHIINHAFQYVVQTSSQFNIDESHALKHSMEVFNTAKLIYDTELIKFPYLINQKEIIYASAILHDMCDKKYMDEQEGIHAINEYMKDVMFKSDLNVVSEIISTMSYSKVKLNGYPNLKEYQLAYHIVREADLLAAYDVDRCVIYQMMHNGDNYAESLIKTRDLFNSRMLKYIRDELFITDYSKNKAIELHLKSLRDLQRLNNSS